MLALVPAKEGTWFHLCVSSQVFIYQISHVVIVLWWILGLTAVSGAEALKEREGLEEACGLRVTLLDEALLMGGTPPKAW